MKLVLAEKPSVAQSIAKVLGAAKREDGYLEGNGYVVSWCVGHLVELAQPEVYDAKYSKWAYDIRTDGVVAIWFGIFRRFYPWSSFCSVSRENVNLGCRVVTGVLCTQIPLKRQRNGMVDKDFLGWHPFRVLDIDMTEEQLSEFSKYYPIQL